MSDMFGLHSFLFCTCLFTLRAYWHCITSFIRYACIEFVFFFFFLFVVGRIGRVLRKGWLKVCHWSSWCRLQITRDLDSSMITYKTLVVIASSVPLFNKNHGFHGAIFIYFLYVYIFIYFQFFIIFELFQ